MISNSKYPCRRKNCKNKQINGRCRFENYYPQDENTCLMYHPKEQKTNEKN